MKFYTKQHKYYCGIDRGDLGSDLLIDFLSLFQCLMHLFNLSL